MKTVYAIVSGSYSDYSVEFIYESKEDAEAYIEEWNKATPEDRRWSEPSIEEMNFHEAGTKPLYMFTAAWWEGTDSTEYSTELSPGGVPKSRIAAKHFNEKGYSYVRIEGTDEQRVAKVLTETVAGFKLELPLLREAKKQGKI